MRGWVAVLALVPAVAWGECFSVETRDGYLDIALSMLDARERGVSERDAIAQVRQHIDYPTNRVAALEAVRLVYGPLDPGPSSVVSGMQIACEGESSR